jgi:peptidyl-tRNA hydrolase, PTH1 family
MKLIIGLGNPGKQYDKTRHNAGYLFLDKLICDKRLAPANACVAFSKNTKFQSEIAEILHKGEKIILVKPSTFMNLSGQAVSRIMLFYKATVDDLIVVSDDIDLSLGVCRIRCGGSSGGHKGIQSIIDTIGVDNFLRVRIGVRSTSGNTTETEEPESVFDATSFVLSRFEKREEKIFTAIIDEAIDYIMPNLGAKEPIQSHTLEVQIDSI